VVTALVVLAAMPTLSARPQVVSLVLLAVTVHAWLRTWEDGRPRWWLVPLSWVWATAHGLWSAGLLLGVVCVVGLLLDRRVRGRGALAAAAVPVLCLVAAALTPVGPRLLLAQLAVSERTSMIPEWGATSFRTFPAFVVALMVAALVVLWTRRGAVPWTHVLLLLTGAGWALLVVRMVPMGAVVLAPLLACAVQAASPVVRRPPTRAATGFVVAAAAVYLVALALVVPRTADVPAGVPTRFEPRLSALPAGSTVLVEDGTGSWIEWAAPQAHPVIDGMLDAYPVDYIRDFYAFRGVQPGWQTFVRGSGARVAVLQRGSAVTGAMRDRLGWRVVQTDRDWVFLTAPTVAASG
jgi:hypothetical protein